MAERFSAAQCSRSSNIASVSCFIGGVATHAEQLGSMLEEAKLLLDMCSVISAAAAATAAAAAAAAVGSHARECQVLAGHSR
jgi:hypothetical protein